MSAASVVAVSRAGSILNSRAATPRTRSMVVVISAPSHPDLEPWRTRHRLGEIEAEASIRGCGEAMVGIESAAGFVAWRLANFALEPLAAARDRPLADQGQGRRFHAAAE